MYLQLAEQMEGRSLVNEGLSGGFFSKIVSSIKTAGKQVVQSVKKIALSVPRNSYLGLVALNVHGLATHLARAIDKDPGPVKRKWEQLGGNFDKLKGAVNSGKKKKQLFDGGNAIVLSDGPNDILTVQTLSTPAVAAAIASAAPIIAALAPLLKAFTKDPETIKQIDAAVEAAAAITPSTTVDPTDPQHSGKFDTTPDKGGFLESIPKPVLYVGGAVLVGGVLYAITRKK